MAPALAALASLLIAAGVGGCSDSDDSATETTAATPPVLLMFHSGAFVFGDPQTLDEARDAASDLGFEPVVVAYPLADLPGAVRATAAAARRYEREGRAVFAYGESAGGTLAALLAERDLVDASATYSQVTDIPALIRDAPDPAFFEGSLRATPRQIARSSPGNGRSRVPLLALTPVADDPSQSRATHRWDGRDPMVRTIDVEGGHLGYGENPSIYSGNAERSLRWLAKRAGVG